MCCPCTKVIENYSKRFSSSRLLIDMIDMLHEDKLCDTLQAMAPTNVKTVHQTSYCISRETTIDSDCCRLPKASVLGNKADKLRSNQL